MLEVISTLGAGFVKNLDDAFGVLPDCQPSRGFSISTFDVTSLGALHALQKKIEVQSRLSKCNTLKVHKYTLEVQK